MQCSRGLSQPVALTDVFSRSIPSSDLKYGDLATLAEFVILTMIEED